MIYSTYSMSSLQSMYDNRMPEYDDNEPDEDLDIDDDDYDPNEELAEQAELRLKEAQDKYYNWLYK